MTAAIKKYNSSVFFLLRGKDRKAALERQDIDCTEKEAVTDAVRWQPSFTPNSSRPRPFVRVSFGASQQLAVTGRRVEAVCGAEQDRELISSRDSCLHSSESADRQEAGLR